MRALVVTLSLALISLHPAVSQNHRYQMRNTPVEPVSPWPESSNSWPEVKLKLILLNDSLRTNSKLYIPDFQVFENGVEQQIRAVSAMDSPISLGLLIDGSGSTQPDREKFEAAAMTIVKGLPEGSEVMAAWFANKANIDLKFVPATEVDFASIERSDMTGGTSIYDALIDTEVYIAANAHNERRALVLLSDGGENSSMHSMEDAVRAFQWPDAPQLFTLDIADPRDTEREREAHVMTSLATGGGGLAVIPGRDKSTPVPESDEKSTAAVPSKGKDFSSGPFADLDVTAAATRLAAILRRQYVLTYITSNPNRDGQLRSLEVKLPPQFMKFKVYVLPGYYAPPEEPTRR